MADQLRYQALRRFTWDGQEVQPGELLPAGVAGPQVRALEGIRYIAKVLPPRLPVADERPRVVDEEQPTMDATTAPATQEPEDRDLSEEGLARVGYETQPVVRDERKPLENTPPQRPQAPRKEK